MSKKLTEYDIEEALAELGVDSAGSTVNPLRYKRHELARYLFSKLDLGRWDGKVEPSDSDDVIIGNG
jgi:hypothetical protein